MKHEELLPQRKDNKKVVWMSYLKSLCPALVLDGRICNDCAYWLNRAHRFEVHHILKSNFSGEVRARPNICVK